MRTLPSFGAIVLLASTAAFNGAGIRRQTEHRPPLAPGSASERVHDVVVVDPYRGLERQDSADTKAWVAAQDAALSRFLEAIPTDAIRSRLASLVSYESVSVPQRGGRRYFFNRSPGDRRSDVGQVFVADRPSGEGRLLLDVRARHGSASSLGTFAVSPDGRYVVYLVHTDGSAWGTAHVLDIERAAVDVTALSGVHRLSRFQWTADGREVFFTTFRQSPDPRAAVTGQALHRYRPGTRSPDMAGVSLGDEPTGLATVRMTDDGRHLVIARQVGTDQRTRISLLATTAGAQPIPLIPEGDATFTFLGGGGGRLYFYTDLEAPRGRVIEVEVRRPARRAWRTVVPESAEAIAARDQTGGNAVGMFAGRLVLMYLRDGRPFLRVFGTDGRLAHTVELPPAGSIWGGFSGRPDDQEVLLQFLGMTDPATILRLNVATGELTTVRRAAIPFDAERFVVRQDFYSGHDGTRIPIFVVHRKDLARDGQAPAMLYGYGALAWVSFIWYQPHLLAWLEMGGVYAQPAIRGGGEYGKAWHEAALRTRKQTAVDDYLAAADWLVRERYTSAERLVATGGSLSAPLAAAALAQRPALFGAAVIDRPVADLVRYEQFTGAAFWTPEFGSVANRDEFTFLHRFSPYHQALKGTCLPPTLVMVGERDQTAPPLHGFKLVAARQAATTCPSPVFLKLMKGAGHDFGKTPEQQADSFTAELAFLARVLRVPASPLRVTLPP